jgi:hypothetical protein
MLGLRLFLDLGRRRRREGGHCLPQRLLRFVGHLLGLHGGGDLRMAVLNVAISLPRVALAKAKNAEGAAVLRQRPLMLPGFK